MLLRFWRLATILLAAFSLSAAVAHLLEMPSKLTYAGWLWLTLLQTLYPLFGMIGGFAEVVSILMAVVLVFLVRGRPAFRWTLAGALCLVASHVAFWMLVAPVNAALGPLTPETLPADWTRFRNQWEYTHATRAVLQMIGFVALVLSLLVEIPDDVPAT